MLGAIEPSLLGKDLEFGQPLVEVESAQLGHGRHHDPLRGVGLVGLEDCGLVAGCPCSTRRLRVADAHGRANKDGDVEALRDVEGISRELECLRRVGRVEHRHARERRVVVRVLLVLGGVHAGVVGDEQYEPAAHPGVGQA